MSTGIAIREATLEDSPAIGALITDLGYETDALAMRSRMQRIGTHPDYVSLVAVQQQQVVGFLGLAFGLFYERTGSYVRIVALSVSSQAQRHGIGGALIRAAETLAQSRGAQYCLVNSGLHRGGAHQFYERHGYTHKGKAFSKALAQA